MKASFIVDPALGRIVLDYGDPAAEALACRTACALFDFSFMARARLEGAGALRALAGLTPRPMHDLLPGRIRYCVRIDAGGRLLADLTVWRHDDLVFEVMSGRRDEIDALMEPSQPDCRVTDLSAQCAIFAVQGPATLAALAALGDVGIIARLPYFEFCETTLAGHRCLVGRLGYTGEPGAEIIVPRPGAQALWDGLQGHARAAGFGAADILRIEAGFVLFANEFQMPVSPAEAGLERFGAPGARAREESLRLVCLRLQDHHEPVLWRTLAPLARPVAPGAVAVTSACRSIVAGVPIGLGFARRVDVEQGRPLYDATGTFGPVSIAPLPIHDPTKERPRKLWSLPA